MSDDRKDDRKEAGEDVASAEEIAKALDLTGLDPELFDGEPTARSLDAIEAMPEDEFLAVTEDAIGDILTDEQKKMLRQNR